MFDSDLASGWQESSMLYLLEFTLHVVLFCTKISKIRQEQAKLQFMKMVDHWYLLIKTLIIFSIFQWLTILNISEFLFFQISNKTVISRKTTP